MNSRHHYIPISKLLVQGRPLDYPVAIHQGRTVLWGEFSTAVSSLAHHLCRRSEARWCLYCDSAYPFLVALFSLFHANKVVVIPPNAQQGTLDDIRDAVDGFISDAPPLISGTIHPLKVDTKQTFVFRELDIERPVLELFTSGSTGSRKCVSKKLSNVESEIDVLEARWGELLGESTVYATVSQQHIYGLLFRALWPIAAGRVLYDPTILYPEALPPLFEHCAEACLISSPAHLTRIPDLVELSKLRPKCKAVFSSGGLLHKETSQRIKRGLGDAPIEVFGSTETGGVAWRQQSADREEDCWNVLEKVRIRASDPDQILCVQSPFVGDLAKEGWIETQDVIDLQSEGRFIHKGRVDSIVKIEGKRVSLREMETRVAEHPFVDQAIVIVVRGGAVAEAVAKEKRRARVETGAIIILNKSGREYLEERGRRVLANELRRHLLQYFDRIVLPRRWRYVDHFPEDRQGKRPLNELEKLFEQDFNPEVTMPLVLESSKTSTGAKFKLQVPDDLYYLKGHFPQFPIVPGFVQIDWVMKLAESALGFCPKLSKMEAVKFHNALTPGVTFFMELTWNSDQRSVSYALHDNQRKYSSGRIYWRECELGSTP